MLEAEAEVGLTIGLEPPLAQAIEATRAIPDPSRRVFLLTRIAQVWETAGRPLEAVATFAEALAAVDATAPKSGRPNALFVAIRGFPGRAPALRLIAETAPQAVRIASSIEDELSRSQALVAIAKALPD